MGHGDDSKGRHHWGCHIPRYPCRTRYRQRPTHQRRSLCASVQKLRVEVVRWAKCLKCNRSAAAARARATVPRASDQLTYSSRSSSPVRVQTKASNDSPAIRKRRVGGEVCGEPNGVSRVVMGEDQRGALPMLKAPMLLAAVLVVCVASSADARRRHHHGYYGYGERP